MEKANENKTINNKNLYDFSQLKSSQLSDKELMSAIKDVCDMEHHLIAELFRISCHFQNAKHSIGILLKNNFKIGDNLLLEIHDDINQILKKFELIRKN